MVAHPQQQRNYELVVMKVPAGAIALSQDGTVGLLVRVDKLDLIDLNINTSTFKDRKSGIDFSWYIVKRIKY